MKYELISPKKFASAIDQIFYNRKISNIKEFLTPTPQHWINPLNLANINQGANLLLSHIEKNSKVWVLADVDVDGLTSAAALLNYLHFIFPEQVEKNFYYSINEGKIHGISASDVPIGIDLVITPDSSSEAIEECYKLKERGVDVLILDHHHCGKINEYACVINNQLCNYSNKDLTGAGIVYKFCQYLDSKLNVNYSERILDIIALGQVGDVCDLRNLETRYIITKGLENISNPFFKEMVIKQSYSMKDGITPFSIAFYIVPYMNATVRMGDYNKKIILLEALLNFKAYNKIPSTKRGHKPNDMEMVVEQAVRNCVNLKNAQNKETDIFVEKVEELIKKNNLNKNQILTVCLEEEVNKSLIGLIANKIADKYQKPTLILVRTDENTYTGSGRNMEGNDLVDFRQFVEDSNLAEFSSGHASAFGTAFLIQNIIPFINYANEKLKNASFTTSYKVDVIYNGANFDGNEILEIAALSSVWGQGVKEPYLCFERVPITKSDITLLSPDKKPTIKINLKNGVEIIKFGSSYEEFESLYSENGCKFINVIGKAAMNTWGSKTTPQIKVADYEISSSLEYYF